MKDAGTEIELMVDMRQERRTAKEIPQYNQRVLSCLAAGDVAEMRRMLEKENMYAYFQQMLPKKTDYSNALCFLCGCIFVVAESNGLPAERCAALTANYLWEMKKLNSAEAFAALQVKILLQVTEEVHAHRAFQRGHKAVAQCKQYVYDHINEKIDSQELAAYCGYSLSALQHLFRRETGENLTAYIRREKVKKSKLLLTCTDETCVAISQKLTFSSQSHFIAVFRKETGMTPAQYRVCGGNLADI